jgi:uncharacterized membrane-anchored protein YjiN (DUF445 family)
MSAQDLKLAARLRRAKWFASGLLAAMVLLFIVTAFFVGDYPQLGIVLAFAEAAVIGGLADWFAVTALFRHPLGVPIPHTAIVPQRKNEIGRALARFVSDHFLIGASVEKRLERSALTRRLGAWLEREDNARRLSRDLGVALDWMLRSVNSSELRGGFKSALASIAERLPINDAVAAFVDVFASGNNAQLLIDQLVQFGRQQLDQNKATIRARIEERSPWWMPKFVDEEIYDQLVSEFESLLSEIGDNHDHPARREFNDRLLSLRKRLRDDEALLERSAQLRNEFVQHPAVQEFFQALWVRIREYLHTSLENPSSEIRLGIEREIRQVGRLLGSDFSAQRKLDSWLRESLVYIVEHYRGPLSEIISDTVEEWDARSTADRIELHIGKDLQFIRINGTLVGGLVGVLLYLSWRALASAT